MINSEEEKELTEILSNDHENARKYLDELVANNQRTMMYLMAKYPHLYPENFETKEDMHKYHHTYTNKETGSKSKRKSVPIEYVRLFSRRIQEYVYYRTFNEKDIGFSNNKTLQKGIIMHARDIDSITNNADMENSFERTKEDIKEGYTGYIFGDISIENINRQLNIDRSQNLIQEDLNRPDTCEDLQDIFDSEVPP